MSRWILLSSIVFGLALAVVVGLRLEASGLAVAAGVVLGILAGLPVSGVLLYLYYRERQARLAAEERHRGSAGQAVAPAAPPVIVLNAGQRGMDLLPPSGYTLGQRRKREYVIVGEEGGLPE